MQLATIILIIEILFFFVLCAGVVVQLRANQGNPHLYVWHDRLQAPVVVLNLLLIIFFMVPTFQAVVLGNIPRGLSQIPTLVTAIHGILGTIAQGLSIYCLLAGFKILPRKIGVLRYWMWAAFIAWTVTILFGIGVYVVFYTGDSSGQQAPTTEHDADLGTGDAPAAPAIETEPDAEPVEEAPAEEGSEESEAVEESVAEHDEAPVEEVIEEATEEPEVVEEEVAEHDEAPVEEVVEEPTEEPTEEPAPEPTEEPAPEPTEELIDEHAEDSEADSDTTSDEGTDSMDELIDEHAEESSVVEPDFAGQAASVSWQNLATSRITPGIRYEQSMHYNAATNQVFLFGGRDGSQIYSDVWVLNVDTLEWQQIELGTYSDEPPARFSAVMVVDDAAENLYIATGHTQGGGNFNDVWKLDLTSNSWQDLTASAGPPPAERYGAPGGLLGGNLVTTHGFGRGRFDDTWQFNLGTEQWENITPAGAVPLKRCLFAATPKQDTLVIHGGCATPNGDCYLDDTWRFDPAAGAWTEILSDVRPVGRQYQTLVDAENVDNRVILYGGQDASRAARDDMWFLDLASGEWISVEAADTAPDARYNHAAVWVPTLNGMLVYGGRNGNGGLGDMWLATFE